MSFNLNRRTLARRSVLAGTALLFAMAHPGRAAGEPARPVGDDPALAAYRLVWQDEFSAGVVDTNVWQYRTGPRLLSFQQPGNVSVTNGVMRLALRREDAGGLHYTAGGLISRRLFTHGYFEARFRCPRGAGWHTSFWNMHTNAPAKERTQEIDICEQDSANNRSYSAGVIDWSGRSGRKSVNFGRVYYRDSVPDFAADFHVWGCEFTPQTVRFFLDGKLTHQTDATQFPHGPQNVWLTCVAALWGNPKKPDRVDDTALPEHSDFDWVRVYEKPAP